LRRCTGDHAVGSSRAACLHKRFALVGALRRRRILSMFFRHIRAGASSQGKNRKGS
jgi:hypothetical protein